MRECHSFGQYLMLNIYPSKFSLKCHIELYEWNFIALRTRTKVIKKTDFYKRLFVSYLFSMCFMFDDQNLYNMMASSNGNIFRVTGPLWGESTGHRWISLTKASDGKLWGFIWSAHEQTVDQTIRTLLICDAIALIMMSLYRVVILCAPLNPT